nr:hypothetical protein SHINE37_10450 [Rhizobiaceae bacterium]
MLRRRRPCRPGIGLWTLNLERLDFIAPLDRAVGDEAFRFCRVRLPVLQMLQHGCEPLDRQRLVAMLGSLVAGDDAQPGWNVNGPDGAVRGVLVLAAGSAGPQGFEPDVARIDRHVLTAGKVDALYADEPVLPLVARTHRALEQELHGAAELCGHARCRFALQADEGGFRAVTVRHRPRADLEEAATRRRFLFQDIETRPDGDAAFGRTVAGGDQQIKSGHACASPSGGDPVCPGGGHAPPRRPPSCR